MKLSKRLAWTITISICSLALVSTGYAQTLDAGEVEATAQAGIVAGVGTQASFAASLGKAINDRVFVLGEFGYVPLGGRNVNISSPGGGFQVASGGKLLSFVGGVQYQFNDYNSFAPYAGAALGAVRSSFESVISGSSNISASGSSTDFYASFSGGARYYVRDRWGFKPELTIFAGNDSFVRFAVGLFYQLRR
jgi:hypothetical protein